MSIDVPAHSPDPIKETEYRAKVLKDEISAFDNHAKALKERFSTLGAKIDSAKTSFETRKSDPYSGFYAPEV